MSHHMLAARTARHAGLVMSMLELMWVHIFKRVQAHPPGEGPSFGQHYYR